MNFNFRYAEVHQGYTYLRFDDTNPEAEEQQYYDRCVRREHSERMGRSLHANREQPLCDLLLDAGLHCTASRNASSGWASGRTR